VNGITFVAARLDADAIMPGHAMAHPRLRPSGRHHDGFAEVRRGLAQGFESGRFNAIVVGQKKLHAELSGIIRR
jgi:hypothetical protein